MRDVANTAEAGRHQAGAPQRVRSADVRTAATETVSLLKVVVLDSPVRSTAARSVRKAMCLRECQRCWLQGHVITVEE